MHLRFQSKEGIRQVVEDFSRSYHTDARRGHGQMRAAEAQTVPVTSYNPVRPANGAGPVFSIVNQESVA